MKTIFNHSKIENRRYKLYEKILKNKAYDENDESELCERCKALGYCAFYIDFELRNPVKIVRYTVRDYLDLVPVQIKGAQFGNYSKHHLQIAYDAFHQQDYETAILHFRAVLEVCNLYEANIGLAVAYFMVKDFESAIRFAEYSSDREVTILTSLKEEIVKFSIDEAAQKEVVITEATTVKSDSNLYLPALQNESMTDARLVSVVG